ncbi:hypothetical protein ATO2_06055 [Roseovarius sp. 22II1-1F6A]|nr:hypothetical protein ATO2_06055 [Roseovarius sp. 22II1-1F6A]
MLKLSDRQRAALASDRMAQFHERGVAHLRGRYPRETAQSTDADLRTLLDAAITRGKPWRVTSEFDVLRLSECLLLHGPDFAVTEAFTWARHILRRDDMTGRQKMTAIADYEAFHAGVSR